MNALKYPALARKELAAQSEGTDKQHIAMEKEVRREYLHDVLYNLSQGRTPSRLLYDDDAVAVRQEKLSRGGRDSRDMDSYLTNGFVFDKLTRGYKQADMARLLGVSRMRIVLRCNKIVTLLYFRALREGKIPVELAMCFIALGRKGNINVDRIRVKVEHHFSLEEQRHAAWEARTLLRARKFRFTCWDRRKKK
jgi:hypothetical protein